MITIIFIIFLLSFLITVTILGSLWLKRKDEDALRMFFEHRNREQGVVINCTAYNAKELAEINLEPMLPSEHNRFPNGRYT